MTNRYNNAAELRGLLKYLVATLLFLFTFLICVLQRGESQSPAQPFPKPLWSLDVGQFAGEEDPQSPYVDYMAAAQGYLFCVTIYWSDGKAILLCLDAQTGRALWVKKNIASPVAVVPGGVVVMQAYGPDDAQRCFVLFDFQGKERWRVTIHPPLQHGTCDSMVASDSFLFAAPYSATDNRLYASQRTAIYKINLQDGKALRLHTYPAFAVDPHLFLDEPFLFLELGHSHALAKVDLRSNEVKKLPGSEDIYYNYLGRDLFVRDRPITEPEAKTGGFYKWLEAVDPATEEVRWKTKLPIENISTAMGESLILSYWFKDEQGCPTSGDIVEEIDLKTGQTVWKYAFANRIFLFETEPGRLIQWLPQVAFVVTSQPGQNYIHVVSRKTGRALRSLAITDEEPLPSNPYLKATTCVLAAGDFLFVARASGRLIVYPVDLFSR